MAEEAASAEASAKDELIRGNPLILGGAAPFQVRMSSTSVPCAACQGGVFGVHPGRRGPVPGACGVCL